MTSAELKQLACDIYDGKVFSSSMLTNQKHLAMIFMPIILGALNNRTKEELKEIAFIYEYLDKAGPRSINGYPIFSSFHILKHSDLAELDKYYQDYKALKEGFLK